MCYRVFSLCFFLIAYLEDIHTENITFVPTPIWINLTDLPTPYNTSSAEKDAIIYPVPSDPKLFIVKDFSIKLIASNFTGPRYLLYTPSGDILVSEPRANRISCLVDIDNDGYPDQRTVFADASNGVNRAYSMVFVDDYFYIASFGDVSLSNVGTEDLPKSSVQQANLDGTNQTTFAYGLRNPVGLAFHPITNELYTACQERDELGDDLVPDFFTRIQQDEFDGFPYAYLSPHLVEPRRTFPNGTSERPDLVAKTRTPDLLFEAHSAVLSLQFYTGTQFPERYKNGAFAAFHGSWNRNLGTGYKIVFVPFNSDTNRPMGYYEDFVTGFLTDPEGPDTFGTPVGLLVLKDGSLLFTDDGNGMVYQVQYKNGKNSTVHHFLSIFLFAICTFCARFFWNE
jgi:glucose/arabinose dehydrogenase